MEQNTLYIVFENSMGTKSKLKINDVKPDVTSEEVAELANKIVDKNAIIGKNGSYVQYIHSELEKTSVEII